MPSSVSPVEIDALGARAEAMVNTLGAISAEPDRLVRLFLTPEHRRAADKVSEWMRAAGLTVSEDALGTVRGRLEGQGAKRLLIGSNIDTVIDAGKRRPVRGDRRHPCGGAFPRETPPVRDRRARI